MNKIRTEPTQMEALVDGLETHVLEGDYSEDMTQEESRELSRSMGLILAASAARAKMDVKLASRKTRSVSDAVRIKVDELKRLLASRPSGMPQLASVLDADESPGRRRLLRS